MKIALLFDGASALGASPDVLILESLDAVEASLSADRHQVTRIPVHDDARWIERLRRGRADLVFNLCEGVDGVAALEPPVIGVLELLGIPFTGSGAWTTALCLRKPLVNALLERAGLPVPTWTAVRRGTRVPPVALPAICKPAAEDASIGVEQRSVVRSARSLAARVASMHERWDEVLVQRFVDGREVNVGILGDEVLPASEIEFGGMPRGMWRIVSYRSKWEVGSEEDVGAVPRCPAVLPEALAAELQRLALSAWRMVGGRGYGRVDFRIDAEGQPWILEVNSNPDLAPDAGLARMARATGRDYGALVRTICELALAPSERSVTAEWALAQQLSGVATAAERELALAGQR